MSEKAFKKAKKGADKLKCDAKFIQDMVNILRLGAYVETAAIMAGTSKTRFYEWMKAADPKHPKHRPIFAELRDAVEKAQEEATVRDLMVVDKCAQGQDWEYERWEEGELDHDGNPTKAGSLKLNSRGNPIPLKVGFAPNWNAAAWRLSRRKAKEWGDSQTIEHKGDAAAAGAPRIIVTIPDNGKSVQRPGDENGN